jgi:hypothetical protein
MLYFIIDGRGKSNDRERICMTKQEMVEITIHDVPQSLARKIDEYARVHNMSADDAVSEIVTQYLIDMKRSV